MQPQFLARFDNAIILEDLDGTLLKRIFTETRDSVFVASRAFFEKTGIDLEITEGAVQKIADAAAKSPRIGARALKGVYGRIIKPFEYDPHAHPAVQPVGNRHKLVITEEMVREALRSELVTI